MTKADNVLKAAFALILGPIVCVLLCVIFLRDHPWQAFITGTSTVALIHVILGVICYQAYGIVTTSSETGNIKQD